MHPIENEVVPLKEKKRKAQKEKKKESHVEAKEEKRENGENQQMKRKKKKAKKHTHLEDNTPNTANLAAEGEDSLVHGHGEEPSVPKEFTACTSFHNANLPEHLFKYCSEKFEKPTQIQSRCWPVLMARRDTIALAETGSGKTLAFLIPLLIHVEKQLKTVKHSKPLVLIIAPTRELAMQIATVCDEVGAVCGVHNVCIFGGVDKGGQRKSLKFNKQKPRIIIATPGRLLDFINEGTCVVDAVSTLVLDEADRMLDAGFEEDIRTIISHLPKHPTRETVVFSATWPPEVRALGNEFLSDPITINLTNKRIAQNGEEEEDDEFALRANHAVKQIVEVISDDFGSKDRKLDELLHHYQSQYKRQQNKNKASWRALVFVLYKKEVSRVENMLLRRGWSVAAIHGDLNQALRFQSLNRFKMGECPILLATDVAARGLDIPDVSVVINYSFPLTIADYIHRIGRTGRAGNTGVSHTLFTSFDRSHAGELVNVLREAKQDIPEDLTKFGTAVKKKEHKLYGAHFKAISNTTTSKHLKFE